MNTVVGVDRIDTGETIRPGDDSSAYLGLTDRRIIIVVANPMDRDDDFVTGHAYRDLVDVLARAETLTAKIKFETVSGQQWLFTSREDDVKPVQTFLSVVCTNSGAPVSDRAELVDHCEALSTQLANGDWEAFDDRLAAATETAATLRDTNADTSVGPAHTEITDLYCLIRDRYTLAGREKLTSAQHLLDTGNFALSYRRARTAFDRFEQAFDWAKQENLATETAMVGLTMADDVADTSLGRLFATGRHKHTKATAHDDIETRIEGLEAALDIYQTVAALVVGDDTLTEDASDRARNEATTTIEALIDARLKRARKQRNAALKQQASGNPAVASAYDETARTDLDRALELASTYPPGDAEEIRAHRAELS